MKSIDQRIKNGQSSASQGLYLENRIRRTFSIQKSKPSPFGHLNLIYWPIIALTLRIQRPIGDLAVLSSHPILDATSPRSSRRAPNQQRHKHCLLALTWHSPRSPSSPTSANGARMDLETSGRHLKRDSTTTSSTESGRGWAQTPPLWRSKQLLFPLSNLHKFGAVISRTVKTEWEKERSCHELDAALTSEMRRSPRYASHCSARRAN